MANTLSDMVTDITSNTHTQPTAHPYPNAPRGRANRLEKPRAYQPKGRELLMDLGQGPFRQPQEEWLIPKRAPKLDKNGKVMRDQLGKIILENVTKEVTDPATGQVRTVIAQTTIDWKEQRVLTDTGIGNDIDNLRAIGQSAFAYDYHCSQHENNGYDCGAHKTASGLWQDRAEIIIQGFLDQSPELAIEMAKAAIKRKAERDETELAAYTSATNSDDQDDLDS